MSERTSAEPMSGDIVTPREDSKQPLVILSGTPDVPPIHVHGCELRIVERANGRIHRWHPTRKVYELVGLEASWIARRLTEIEEEAAALRKTIGAEDLNALVQRKLMQDLADSDREIERLRERVAVLEARK